MFLPDWLVVANGEPLPQERLRRLAENKSILVLDGALPVVLQAKLKPQLVLGDFDSLHPDDQKKYEGQFLFHHEPDQDATDLEKALLYLEKAKAATVTLVNASGWRMDHSLYNLGLLKRFHQRFQSLLLVTAYEHVCYVENQTLLLKAETPQPLSLLAFPAAKVETEGLQYELQGLALEIGRQESVSNQLLRADAKLSVKGSLLLLFSPDTQIASP